MNKLLIITQKVDKNDQLLGFFIEWLRRLAGKFNKLTVICLEKGDFDLPENIEVISLGKEKDFSKIRQLARFYKLIYQLRNHYQSVLVHMNPIWAALGGLVWRFMGKKIILWYTHKSVTIKLRIAEWFTDVILTASRESFRLQSKKIIITGHGIDTELFRPDPSKLKVPIPPRQDRGSQIPQSGIGTISHKLKILSVGRIAPVKNYECLINAAKILMDKQIDFEVTMIGETALPSDENYQQKLKAKISQLNLGNFFSFLGKINHQELVEYYQSHDIFVHLSRTGSLDKTILEAMASGMKVISSNDASKTFLSPEMVFNDHKPEELANKIIRLSEKYDTEFLREYVAKNHNLKNLIEKIYLVA